MRALALLSLVGYVAAASYTLSSPRFSIISAADPTPIRAEPLSTSRIPSPALNLSSTDTLRLQFTILDKESGKGVTPHQTFLRLSDDYAGEEAIIPLKVTTGGKVKWDLHMGKPPASLPPTSASRPLRATLLLGSFTYSPVSIPLFDVYLPESSAPASDPSFGPQPEIQHTFRAAQKLPNTVFPLVFSLVAISPWALLAVLLSRLTIRLPNLLHPTILPFTALLVAFEGLLAWYWVALKLGDVLLYGGILALLTAVAGRRTLRVISRERLSVASK